MSFLNDLKEIFIRTKPTKPPADRVAKQLLSDQGEAFCYNCSNMSRQPYCTKHYIDVDGYLDEVSCADWSKKWKHEQR